MKGGGSGVLKQKLMFFTCIGDTQSVFIEFPVPLSVAVHPWRLVGGDGDGVGSMWGGIGSAQIESLSLLLLLL